MTQREALEALSASFDSVAHLLEPAITRGTGGIVLSDYKERVMSGDMQLWVDEGYAAVTEVVNYPSSRVVLVHLAGGELDPLIAADGELEKFARIVEATGIEVTGRKGWARALKDRGYREAAVLLVKEV